MRVADYVAQFVAAAGVRTVYMLSGTGSIHLDNAFSKSADLRYVCARHESAAAVMASGAAKLSGSLSVAVVTTGPGGLNAIAGVAEAYVDSVPLLVISGQEENRYYTSKERSFGVQGFDITRLAAGVTKYAALLANPSDIPSQLEHAIKVALSGRPGPVWLDIPSEVQAAEINADPPNAFHLSIEQHVSGNAVEQAAKRIGEVLGTSRRPVIVVGGGYRRTGKCSSILRLGTMAQAPIVSTRFAIDLIPYSEPDFMGLGGIRGRPATGPVLHEADLIVAFGASLGAGFTGIDASAFSRDIRILAVCTDRPQHTSPGLESVEWHSCDAVEVVERLLSHTALSSSGESDDWILRCRAFKARFPITDNSVRSSPINSYHFLEELDALSGRTDIFASDAGGSYYATGQALRFEKGQRDLTSATFATMGIALPLAIGAASDNPHVRVLVVTGDGSIELNVQELKTISEYNLNIKVFVMNNGRYASIRDSQDALCGGVYTETDEVLNFASVAQAFGLPYLRASCATRLTEDLSSALETPGPILIEVMCDPRQHMVLPKEALWGVHA